MISRLATLLALTVVVCGGGNSSDNKDALSAAREEDLKAFLQWATAQGIRHEDRFRVAGTGDAGRGLVAVRDFQRGETLLAVPEAAIFSPESASRSTVGKAFAEAGLVGCAGDTASAKGAVTDACMQLLVATLLYEASDPASFWAPWMKVLPRTLGSPLFWTKPELLLLQGSNTLGMVAGWKKHIKGLYAPLNQRLFSKRRDMFPKKTFSLKQFTWGFATVFSRAFDIDVPRGASLRRERVMAPLADLFNHGNVSSSYTFAADSAQFQLVTHQVARTGEEVLLNYDSKSNADFLFQYGFVVPDNPSDEIGLVAGIGSDAPQYQEKMAVLAELGVSRDGAHRLAREGLPHPSLNAIRVLCAVPEEMPRARRVLQGKEISAANNVCLWQTVSHAIQAMLDKYPESLIQDEALLREEHSRQGLSPRARTAITLRRDEKRILLLNLARFKKRLSAARQAADAQQQEL